VATQTDIWPIDRIRGLSKSEASNLRSNALARGNQAIVERCDQVLSTNTANKVSSVEGKTRIGMDIPETAVGGIAKLFLALPKASDVPNAQARLKRLSIPAQTFSVLWRQYINCGFSSQEKSDPDTPLGRFAKGDSPLLDLQSIFNYGEDPKWIAAELKAANMNRMTQKKTKLVLSARKAFWDAKGHDDLLVNGRSGVGLDMFLDLARGRVHDRDIATSAQFSQSINADQLYGIGHKQIRNILVNTGLAHNVLPIDSRWKAYLGHQMHFESRDLARQIRYLEIEDVIRKGLMLAQESRDDIPNLAVLDSVVFAVQSVQGHVDGIWTGA